MGHHWLSKLLSSHIDSCKLLCLCANPNDPEEFVVGTVLRLESDVVMLRLRGRQGAPDGICFLAADLVRQVSTSNDYLAGIEALSETSEQVSSNTAELEVALGGLALPEVLSLVQRKSMIASIYDHNWNVLHGFIREANREFVVIEVVLDHGQVEGRYDWAIDSVVRVDVCKPQHDSLLLLYTRRLGL